MIKAVIFDFDGTILDTEIAWYHAFCGLYEQHGAKMTMDVYSKIIGTSPENEDAINPYSHLEMLLNKKLPHDKLQQDLHQRYHELMVEQVLRPGVLDYLKEAKKLGLKIGLASSSGKAWIRKYFDALDIEHYFETIMTADDVSQVKPDPELYQKAVENLGVAPSEAIAIEDSPNGCKSAVAAGLHTIIVPHAVTERMEFPEYSIKVKSLEEKSLAEVIEILAGR